MRSEVRALLRLKRTPFEDKLMKLFTRDELVSLYRRSEGVCVFGVYDGGF